jgi:hypothetical protein
MADALQEELLSVPGVAGAEVESDEGMAGVRVQLAEGADAEAVGAAVRRILSSHGMRPAAADRVEPVAGPPPPPGAPGSIVTFPLVGEHARVADGVAGEPVAGFRLEGVAVAETPTGITLSVRATDGRVVDQQVATGGSGLDDAVIAAVADMVGSAVVGLTDVTEHSFGEHRVLTVLLTGDDGALYAGAAVQRGGRAYAVARAAWVALTEPV